MFEIVIEGFSVVIWLGASCVSANLQTPLQKSLGSRFPIPFIYVPPFVFGRGDPPRELWSPGFRLILSYLRAITMQLCLVTSGNWIWPLVRLALVSSCGELPEGTCCGYLRCIRGSFPVSPNMGSFPAA